MDLSKFIPKRGEEKTQEFYWSLIVEPGWVTAGIWTISEKIAKVIAVSLPVAWEEKKELINASDSVLSAVVQGLPDDFKEPSKTVFGVSSAWVQNGEIKGEYLSLIKEICTGLSLSPIGFVVIPEAITHYVRSNEGSPPNIVSVGVYKDVIEVSVFRLGKLVGTTQVSRSVNFDEDVIEGISRFADGEPIPTRFTLYNSKEGEMEEARQSLIKVNWEDYSNLKLLHTPKIEIMASDEKVQAVCFAGASEIAEVSSLERVDSSVQIPGSQEISEESADEKNPSPEDLGFVTEQESVEPTEEVMQVSEKPEGNDNIGDSELSNVSTAQIKSDFFIDKKEDAPGFEKEAPKDFHNRFKFSFDKKPIIFGSIILVFLLVLGLVFWWFVPKATVIVYVSPQKLDEKISMKIDTLASSVNLSENILPARKQDKNVSADRTKETTGTKTVGDKARGEVTLYRVGPALSVKSGTVLLGPQNLKFILDETVNIASGSAGSPGTTKVKTSADGIGVQYNLAGGSNFTVGNFSTSDIEAKNESAFSGGTSRQISSVSEEDRKTLEKELTDELLEKASVEVSQGIEKDEFPVKESNTFTINSEKYSNKVGDEAAVLKLSLDLNVSVLIINRNLLGELVSDELKNKTPEGYTMVVDQMDYHFSRGSSPEKNNEYSVEVVANMVPRVDGASLSKKIRGKLITTAKDILEREVPGFSGVEIKIKPSLPGRLKTLPHVLKNITFELSAEK